MTASLEVLRAELYAAVSDVAPGHTAVDELCLACVALLDVDGATVSTVHQGASQWTFGFSDESARRLDEHQFTFGEGPCIDAVATHRAVLVPDLGSTLQRRWPAFTEAALDDGVRGVFALPITIGTRPVGALGLFRAEPGPLHADAQAGAVVAAELAARSLLELVSSGALEEEAQDGDRDGQDGGPDRDRPASRGGDAMDVNRVEVYQATGMLIHQLGVGPGEALVRLRAHAMATDRTVSRVAYDIIERRLSLRGDDRYPDQLVDDGSGAEKDTGRARGPDDAVDDGPGSGTDEGRGRG